jgi:hypothetical protein
MPNVTPIIISPWKRLLIRLGLKHHTDRDWDSNPYFPEPHPREAEVKRGACPYGSPGDYLRPRASSLLLLITRVSSINKWDDLLWRIEFERIYP